MQIQISWLLRSQLIWIYTVCKNRVYPGSAGQGLIWIGCLILDIKYFQIYWSGKYYYLYFCKMFMKRKKEDAILTFTTDLWANLADNKLMFFLFFPENRICHFMQIVSIWLRQFVCNVMTCLLGKIWKIFLLKFLPRVLSVKWIQALNGSNHVKIGTWVYFY